MLHAAAICAIVLMILAIVGVVPLVWPVTALVVYVAICQGKELK